MVVVYITGASHSGSTLLDLMLNAHPAMVSVGEMLKLNRQLKPRNSEAGQFPKCSCGAASLWECSFWSRVNEHIRQTQGKSLAELDVQDYSSVDGATNVTVFKAIAKVSKRKFVVDSSKMPRRLSHLMKLGELNVYPIHLVRDPMGQVFSVRRKQGGLLTPLFQYEVVHAQIHRALRTVPHTVVRYEELVSEPRRTLNAILEPLGLSFHPQQLAWAEQEKHLVAGNHMRWKSHSDLILDERWKEGLSKVQKLLIYLGTVLSRHLLRHSGFTVGADSPRHGQ
jgi:hypothetical protein